MSAANAVELIIVLLAIWIAAAAVAAVFARRP